MDFSDVLRKLKGAAHGTRRFARAGWNGKGMFIYLVPGSTFTASRPPLDKFHPAGTETEYLPHIDLRTADGKYVPWSISQTDVFAEDWTEIEE